MTFIHSQWAFILAHLSLISIHSSQQEFSYLLYFCSMMV
jgi:hypothetical protein